MGNSANPQVVLIPDWSTRPAGDEVFVNALLAFLNGAEIALMRSPLSSEDRRALKAERLATPANADRARLTRLIQALLDQSADAFYELLPLCAAALQALKLTPTVEWYARGVRLVVTKELVDETAVLNYATALLLDDTKPYGKALSRCKLASCGSFYLARKHPAGGPANRNYCSARHRSQAHESGRADRTRRQKVRKSK
jgi:hypothetical protein